MDILYLYGTNVSDTVDTATTNVAVYHNMQLTLYCKRIEHNSLGHYQEARMNSTKQLQRALKLVCIYYLIYCIIRCCCAFYHIKLHQLNMLH